MSTIKDLKIAIDNSNNIVFVGGAGVSTASGLPDFRGKDGIYTKSTDAKPEEKLSKKYFKEHTSEWFKFYRERMMFDNVEPNIVHFKLAELEEKGKLKAIITQNIDGLHQKAGSKTVIELHGTASECYCTRCGRIYDGKYIKEHCDSDYISRCVLCEGIVRPNLTMYDEGIDAFKILDAQDFIRKADMLIVAGTSLKVHPTTSLVKTFYGKTLAILNEQPTMEDNRANIVLRDNLVDVFNQI